jgi:hypothetical protein
MKLPGKLTEKHIKAHMDMDNSYFFYKNQKIDVKKIWEEIQKGKKSKKEKISASTENRNRHQTISAKPEKNSEL